MSLAIKNATICDGTGRTPYKADVFVKDNKIEKIGKAPNAIASSVIDAEGLFLTPGFVDTHRHFDFAVLTDENFGERELAQGITTAVAGNCGLAPYPCSENVKKEMYDFISPCVGTYSGSYHFSSFKDYVAHVGKNDLYMNVGFLSATGAIKTVTKGFSKTPFSASEMEKAQSLLCDSLEAGALGISCGIMYPPECYTTKDEFTELLKPTKKYNKILTSHIRGEGDSLLKSVREIIDIAKNAELRVNISHLKATGKNNWQKEIFSVIQLIEDERSKGFEVSADVYPYIGGSTVLTSLLPPDFIEDSIQETLFKLETKSGIDKLRGSLSKKYEAWDNMVESIGWDRIIINGVEQEQNYKYQGKNVLEICNKYGFSDPVEFVAKLLVEEKGRVSIIVMSMCQEDLDTIIALDYTAIISDALYSATKHPHPRLNASFSKILREYVFERNFLTLEKAIHKMTYMPSQRFSMKKKGIIEIGADADLLLFGIKDIKDNANFENPTPVSTGIKYAIVNGHIAMKDNVLQRKKGNSII